jgi:hypothetical protein
MNITTVHYNLTELQQADNIGKLLTFSNNATGGILVGFFMIALFFIIMILLVSRRYDFDDILLADSFACFMLSAVFTYGGYLNILFPIAFLTILAFTGFYSFFAKSG